MPVLQSSDRRSTAGDSSTESTGRDGRLGEALHVRNYDVTNAHSVTIGVTDPNGARIFRRRYHLRPGQTRSVAHDVPPGTYDVVVEVDGYDRKTRRVDVGSDPRETALVELGNGITSISQGLY